MVTEVNCEACDKEMMIESWTVGAQYWCSTTCMNKHRSSADFVLKVCAHAVKSK